MMSVHRVTIHNTQNNPKEYVQFKIRKEIWISLMARANKGRQWLCSHRPHLAQPTDVLNISSALGPVLKCEM